MYSEMTIGQYLFLATAGFGAGVVNGIAGGGSMISFPALLAVGLPALSANVTSTVGIWTGYLGGVGGFRSQISDHRERVRSLAVTALAGAMSGSILILATSERTFDSMAPGLVFGGCALFAVQPFVRSWLDRADRDDHKVVLHAGVWLAAVYGAYFGAGLGVVLLAMLGLTMTGEIHQLNGIRAVLALLVNSLAVVVFAIAAPVDWRAAVTMAGTSFVGGWLGATTSLRMPPGVMRGVVLSSGLLAGTLLLLG